MLKSMVAGMVQTVSNYWQIKSLVGNDANVHEVIATAKLLAQAGYTQEDVLELLVQSVRSHLREMGVEGAA